MRERTVSISSAGKAFSFTGWKVGRLTADAPLIAAVRTAEQYLTYVSAGPFQYAIAEALRLPDAYFDEFRADHRRKRDLLSDGLRAAGFEVYQAQATYFITTDIAPFGEKDAYAFCRAPRTLRRRRRPQLRLLRRPVRGPQPGPLHLLQEGRHSRRGGQSTAAPGVLNSRLLRSE